MAPEEEEEVGPGRRKATPETRAGRQRGEKRGRRKTSRREAREETGRTTPAVHGWAAQRNACVQAETASSPSAARDAGGMSFGEDGHTTKRRYSERPGRGMAHRTRRNMHRAASLSLSLQDDVPQPRSPASAKNALARDPVGLRMSRTGPFDSALSGLSFHGPKLHGGMVDCRRATAHHHACHRLPPLFSTSR